MARGVCSSSDSRRNYHIYYVIMDYHRCNYCCILFWNHSQICFRKLKCTSKEKGALKTHLTVSGEATIFYHTPYPKLYVAVTKNKTKEERKLKKILFTFISIILAQPLAFIWEHMVSIYWEKPLFQMSEDSVESLL